MSLKGIITYVVVARLIRGITRRGSFVSSSHDIAKAFEDEALPVPTLLMQMLPWKGSTLSILVAVVVVAIVVVVIAAVERL